MQVIISRTLGKIIALLFISLTMASANINHNYATMSTPELEKAVEHMSLKGEVPFAMGLELIKRWTKVT